VFVALNEANGSVDPKQLWVKPQQPGKAYFWSGGRVRGHLVATATGNPYGAATRDVVYVWPIGFLVAVVIGVLAGAVATMVFRKRPKTVMGAIGVFAGALVTGSLLAIVGSVLGVKVLSFDPAAGGGLAFTGVLALMGAWLGAEVFKMVGGRAAGP
jgi:hypothetical protein